MPNLILDAAAMELAARKLAGQPVFSGPDGAFLDPGLEEVVTEEVDDDAVGRWQAGDDRTRLIVLGAEACRELCFQAERLADASQRRRVIKSMSVPVCSLMDVVDKLLVNLNNENARNRRRSWPATDQETYLAVGRRLRKKRLQGPVRNVRNKLGAHLDLQALGDRTLRLSADDLLGAMGDAVVLLMLATNHYSDAFCWIRGVGMTEDRSHRIVETMFSYPVCVRWLTDLDGHVVDVGCIQLAEDPRRAVQQSVIAAVQTYNDLRKSFDCSLPEIWMRPSEEVQADETSGTEAPGPPPTPVTGP